MHNASINEEVTVATNPRGSPSHHDSDATIIKSYMTCIKGFHRHGQRTACLVHQSLEIFWKYFVSITMHIPVPFCVATTLASYLLPPA